MEEVREKDTQREGESRKRGSGSAISAGALICFALLMMEAVAVSKQNFSACYFFIMVY
jgi:hypothetical protein